MSKKSSKLDLLVRVRFENPLPDPPFPPKLLKVETDIARLGEPSYLDQLATSTKLPVVLDSEMGMPIDLSTFEGVFDGSDAALNPTLDSKTLDPEDAALLTPLNVTAGGVAPKPEVSWMRNSSYIQRTERTRRRAALESQTAEVVDASEAAQIAAIEKSFTDIQDSKLEDIRHPDAKRKHLRVVESYDILPEDEAWSNSYILFKFPERPNAATSSNPSAEASRGRLERAVLRPVVEDDQQLVDYFLPPEADLERLSTLEETPLTAEALERVTQLDGEENLDEVYPVSPAQTPLTIECHIRQDPNIRGGQPGAAAEGVAVDVLRGRRGRRRRHVRRRARAEETQGRVL